MKCYRFYSKETGIIIDAFATSKEIAIQDLRENDYYTDFPDLRFVSKIPVKA